jgi:putative copper export protein
MIPAWLMFFLHFLDYGINLFFLGFVFFVVIIRKLEFKKKWLYLGYGFGLFSSTAWMLATSLDMVDGWDSQSILYAMTKTAFAHWWCFRLILLAVGLISTHFVSSAGKGRSTFLFLSLAVPMFSSLTGHAGTSESFRVFRIGLDYSHFVAASVWAGGLLGVFLFLARIQKSGPVVLASGFQVVKRFSHFAMASTGILMASGLAQIYLIENSFRILWRSDYGKLIFLKFFLFCAALLIAAVNQFIHLNRYKEGNDLEFAVGVRREIGIEILIILLVLVATSILTRTNLPGM